MSDKLDQVKGQLAALDAQIEDLNTTVSGLLDDIEEHTMMVYEESPGVELHEKLSQALRARMMLALRREQLQIDQRFREAWGADWDAVAGDNQKFGQ